MIDKGFDQSCLLSHDFFMFSHIVSAKSSLVDIDLKMLFLNTHIFIVFTATFKLGYFNIYLIKHDYKLILSCDSGCY